MATRHSLRRRAAFGIALLAIMIVGAHSVVLYSVADEQEDDLMDQIVSEELDHLIDQYHSDPSVALSRSQLLKAYIVHGEAGHAALPSFLAELPVGSREIAVGNSYLHVGVRTEGDVRFYVAYDVTRNEARLRELGWLLVLGIAMTAVVASILGYWVAGFVVQPVARLAERVEHLGPSRPSRPLASDFIEEEIGRLAQAFDGYLGRVAELIDREQEFTANVSHELRTPLTAIQTSCELLYQDPALGESARRRVAAIDRAAERLTETARSLLFLARGANAPRLEEVSVQECVVEAAEPVLPILARKGIDFETSIDTSAMVRADRTALFLVAGNLLRNAASYTERGRVRVAYRDGCLVIEDSGPGIDAAILPRVGERFVRGAHAAGDEGIGLGLAIVKRICERFGWQLDIQSSPSAGTRVTVRFPLPSSQDFHTIPTGS